MRRMFRPAMLAVAVALAGGLVALAARTALAAPTKDPENLKVGATVAPARIGPGQSGVVKLVVTIRKTVHVYADKFKVLPTAVDGVTYGKPEFKTKTSPYVDPFSPDEPAEPVWFDKLEIELPFTLTDAALPPLKVGADIKWSCCDEGQCYAPEKTKVPALADVLPPEGWVRPAGAPPVAPVPAGDVPAMSPEGEPAPAPSGEPAPGGKPTDKPTDKPADTPSGKPAPASAAKPAELTLSSNAATVLVRATDKEITIAFTPAEGYHLYPPDNKEGDPIRVTGKEAEGIRWRDPIYPPGPDEIHETWTLTQPYAVTEAAKSDPTFVIHWQGCAKQCDAPVDKTVAIVHEGGKPDGALQLVEVKKGAPSTAAPAVPPTAPAKGPVDLATGQPLPGASALVAGGGCAAPGGVPARGKLFAEIGNTRRETIIDKWWREYGLLILAFVFATGLALAFTPCVLPLVPITVSIIGGSNAAEMSKGRLTFLLSCYVAGLSLAFGSLGLIAALTGGGMAAAFQSSIAIFVIAAVFVVLGFGMFGVFELQPPAWLQRLQGGAKGGSPVGAFLMGALGAVIASPCTGPVIAAMLVFTAQSGNTLLGFLMFVTLGLGMGTIFFAAGSLNLLMKPGPWMVWVRYVFGLIIVGAGLYYLADARKISPRTLFIAGGVIALAAAILIQRHLIRKEGDEPGAATKKGTVVGVALALVTLFVAMLTRPPEGAIPWKAITSREQLCAEVEKAKAEGKAVCVDFWAEWCKYCKDYDAYIEARPELRMGFLKLACLRVDLSSEDRPWEDGVREGLEVPQGQQPYLVFLTAKGEIVADYRTEGPPNADTERKFTEILKTFGALK